MRCYKCNKIIKGSDRSYIPSYRLFCVSEHLHEECKGRTLYLQAFWTFLLVREEAGYDNSPYFEGMVDYLIMKLREP